MHRYRLARLPVSSLTTSAASDPEQPPELHAASAQDLWSEGRLSALRQVLHLPLFPLLSLSSPRSRSSLSRRLDTVRAGRQPCRGKNEFTIDPGRTGFALLGSIPPRRSTNPLDYKIYLCPRGASNGGLPGSFSTSGCAPARRTQAVDHDSERPGSNPGARSFFIARSHHDQR